MGIGVRERVALYIGSYNGECKNFIVLLNDDALTLVPSSRAPSNLKVDEFLSGSL